jgi:hypothetical protein
MTVPVIALLLLVRFANTWRMGQLPARPLIQISH